jgi:hypothetical protein
MHLHRQTKSPTRGVRQSLLIVPKARMGDLRDHEPVLLFLALFSRYDDAIAWGRQRACSIWGPVALESERFAFEETRFYEKTMGTGLHKVLLVFRQLVDPAGLPSWKLHCNQWEQEYAAASSHDEPRPLNMDPGYVTEAKLVLASTKDRDHRIYLSQGIFAENTLYYQGHAWQIRPWTYPNYQRPDYHQFLDRCRTYYRRRKRGTDPLPD